MPQLEIGIPHFSTAYGPAELRNVTHRSRPSRGTYELSDGHARQTANTSVRIASPTTSVRGQSGINVSGQSLSVSPALELTSVGDYSLWEMAILPARSDSRAILGPHVAGQSVDQLAWCENAPKTSST
jgi:hypothetical protein